MLEGSHEITLFPDREVWVWFKDQGRAAAVTVSADALERGHARIIGGVKEELQLALGGTLDGIGGLSCPYRTTIPQGQE